MIDCNRHQILAAHPRHGPPPDVAELNALQAQRPVKGYGQRWQVETVNSMLKRRQGHALTARAQNRQMLLACVAHNVMVVR